MIGRIVITSVPRGLDGSDGVQVVQRTQGLSAPIADRLAQLGSYPHPYDFGDPRNPRVLFHRIERAGGRTFHVLGSVRDAGASYSGRSNHLAEIIAIDDDEIRPLPGGPAYAAGNARWLTQWQGEPREVPLSEEPVVPARDPDDPAETGRPIRCAAWEEATGDAGWAGELAKSFVDGRRALVWVNQVTDAASLFAEAARLLPPSVRWQVEFNTCEIEPFPAHWRAVRQEPEFTVVGPRPSAQDLVLDLDDIRKKGLRAPDHPLAQRARGESAGRAASAGSSAASASATAPGVPPGGLADADTAGDAALNARLRAISEDRRRRSGVTARAGASDADAPWWNWRVAAAAAIVIPLACSVIAAVVLVVRDPNRALELWNGFNTGSIASSSPTAAGGLRSEAESEELARRKEERDQEEERQMAAAEAERRKKAEEERAAKEAERRMAKAKEDAEKHRRETDAATLQDKEKAKKFALDRFLKNDDQMTLLIRPKRPKSEASALVVPSDDLRPADQDLCAFDAPHLDAPECKVWSCVNPNEKRLWVEPDKASDSPAWTVEGQRFDPLAADWVSQTVCRLVVRDGRLWLEWPDKQITSEHALFEAIEETSLLEISCKDDRAGGEGKRVRRWIRFAAPIELREDQSRLKVDPLVEQKITLKPEELVKRIATIDPESLRWKFKLSHKTGPDVVIEKPTAEYVIRLPDAPIVVGYEDVDSDTDPPALIEKQGRLQVAAKVAFVFDKEKSPAVREDAHFKVTPIIEGLENVPLLSALFNFDFLRVQLRKGAAEYERKKNDQKKALFLNDLKMAVFSKLSDRPDPQLIYDGLVFTMFLNGLDKDLRGGIADLQAFSQQVADNERAKMKVLTPGYHIIGNKGLNISQVEYDAAMEPLLKASRKLGTVSEKWQKFRSRRLSSDAEKIREAVARCRDDFSPMCVEVLSISAAVTPSVKPTADDGKEKPSPPTDPPLLIDLIKPRSN